MAKNNLEVLYTVLEILVAVACCLGNLLVIWAVWMCGAMRRQPTFCFIVALATTDLLVGAVAVPMAVLVDGQLRTSFHGCLFLSCVVIGLTQASVHFLLAIALDRYLRVFSPLRYRSLVTPLLSWAVVGVCWLSAAILGFIPMFGWYRHDTLERMQASNSTTITCTFLSVIPMTYMVYFNFFTCILPPLVVMAMLYVCIFVRIHRQLRGGSGGVAVLGSGSRSYYHKERGLAASLLQVLLLFCVCWLPLHLLNAVTLHHAVVPHQAFYAGILLSHANSAANPLLYALKIRKIREALATGWRRHALCTGKQEGAQASRTSEYVHSSTNNNRVEQHSQ